MALRNELDVDENSGLSFACDSLEQRQCARVKGAAVVVEKKMVARQSRSDTGSDLLNMAAGGWKRLSLGTAFKW